MKTPKIVWERQYNAPPQLPILIGRDTSGRTFWITGPFSRRRGKKNSTFYRVHGTLFFGGSGVLGEARSLDSARRVAAKHAK